MATNEELRASSTQELVARGIKPEVRIFLERALSTQAAQYLREMNALRATVRELEQTRRQNEQSAEIRIESLERKLEKFLNSPANTVTRAKLVDLINSGEIK